MINYFNQINYENYVYSLDNIRLTVRWNLPDAQHFMNWLSAFEMEFEDKDYRHFMSSRLFTYRHMFTLGMGESSITVGVDFLNAAKSDSIIGFVEFNPNKVCKDFRFIKFNNKLRETCKEMLCSRWDFAVDIPVSRDYMRLDKDNRNYETCKTQLGFTEYLGVRNKDGRVKLYDKTRESGLDYDLTRLEVTIEGLKLYDEVNWPRVLGIVTQLDFKSNVELSKTDLVLFRLLLQCDNLMDEFKQLGRDKQKKLKPYLFGDKQAFEVSRHCYSSILQQVKDYEIRLIK